MLRPLLKLAGTKFYASSRSKNHYDTSSGARHALSSHRIWRPSTEPTNVMKPAGLYTGRQFTRLEELGLEEGRREGWEMCGLETEQRTTNFVGRGGGGEQVEGRVPVDAIHVQREVELVNHRII